MSSGPEVKRIHRRLVHLNTQLHAKSEAEPREQLERRMQLRQALRDLCIAAGQWDTEMESAHQADMTALQDLIGSGAKHSQRPPAASAA